MSLSTLDISKHTMPRQCSNVFQMCTLFLHPIHGLQFCRDHILILLQVNHPLMRYHVVAYGSRLKLMMVISINGLLSLFSVPHKRKKKHCAVHMLASFVSFSQSVSQSVIQSVSFSQSVSQSVSHTVCQSVSQSSVQSVQLVSQSVSE